MERTIAAIDIGTSKICTLVGRVEEDNELRIVGVGIEPSRGMKRGVMVDLEGATTAIARSVEKAQRSSGYEIRSAWVSLAGSHVSSINSKGTSGVAGGVVRQAEISRALETAQAAEMVVFGVFTRVRSYVEDAIKVPPPYSELIRRVAAMGRRVALLNFGNPYVLGNLPKPAISLCTSNTSDSSRS